jgi:hypothetical protein
MRWKNSTLLWVAESSCCAADKSNWATLLRTLNTKWAVSTKLLGRAPGKASAGVQVGAAWRSTAVSRDNKPACKGRRGRHAEKEEQRLIIRARA